MFSTLAKNVLILLLPAFVMTVQIQWMFYMYEVQQTAVNLTVFYFGTAEFQGRHLSPFFY